MKYFLQALWIGLRNLAIWAVFLAAIVIGMTLLGRYPLEFFMFCGTVIAICWLFCKTMDLKSEAEKRERQKECSRYWDASKAESSPYWYNKYHGLNMTEEEKLADKAGASWRGDHE